MATRKINTRFLVLLGIVFGVFVAGILIATRMITVHPTHYIDLGKQAAHEKRWNDAVNDFKIAARIAPEDPEIQMWLGESYQQIAKTDFEAGFFNEGACYRRALENNPRYSPALQAAYNWSKEAIGSSSDPALTSQFFRDAVDYARRARDAAPENPAFTVAAEELIIQRWLQSLESDQVEVNAALDRLQAQYNKDPSDAELVFNLSRARIYQGSQLAAQNAQGVQTDDVTAFYQKALKTFTDIIGIHDGKEASQEKNALMHFYFAQVLQMLRGYDLSKPPGDKTYFNQSLTEIERARALIKPADPMYLPVVMTAAQMELSAGNRDKAIHIYRSLPTNPVTQIALADALGQDPKTRKEGEGMLTDLLNGLDDNQTHLGSTRFNAMLKMATLKTYDFAATTDPDEKKLLHTKIAEIFARLDATANSQNNLDLQEAEARFHVTAGGDEEIDEVAFLNKLLDANPAAKQRFLLNAMLEKAYEDTNQISKAISVLQAMQTMFPNAIEVRRNLLTLQARENPAAAMQTLIGLKDVDPNDPQLMLYQIQQLMSEPEKNKDKIQAIYAKIPETTLQQNRAKSWAAIAMLKSPTEGDRLVDKVTGDKACTPEDYVRLVSAEFNSGDKKRALAIAQRGAKAFPANEQLKVMVPELEGEDPRVIIEIQKRMAEDDPDKVRGQLSLAQLAEKTNDTPGFETHLKNALKLNPSSIPALQKLYQLYLQSKRLKDAEELLPQMIAADVDSTGGRLCRLALAEQRGDLDTARAIAESLTQDKAEFAQTWLALGDVMSAQGQYLQAIPQYQLCLSRQSANAEAFVGLVRCYDALNRPEDAMHAIEDGLRRLPNNLVLRQMRVNHELSGEKPEQAIVDIQKLIHMDPDNPRLYALLGRTVDSYSHWLSKHGHAQEASQMLVKAAGMLPDQIKRFPDAGELYSSLVEIELDLKDGPKAMAALQAWIARPNWSHRPEPHMGLANLLNRLGRTEEAEAEMHTAMARSNYDVGFQLSMVDMLLEHRKFDEALALMRATNANDPDIKGKIVQVLLQTGHVADAEASLKAQLETNPPNAESLLMLWTDELMQRGHYQEAIEKATLALAKDPANVRLLMFRARSSLSKQPADPVSAQHDLNLIRQSLPNDADVIMMTAQADILQNRVEEAIGELLTCLHNNPGNKSVRLKLVELYSLPQNPRYTVALQLLQDVDSIPPFNKDPDIAQNEAMLFASQHDLDSAVAASNRAFLLAPTNPRIVESNMQLLLSVGNYQGAVDFYQRLPDDLKVSSASMILNEAIGLKKLNDPAAPQYYAKALGLACKSGSLSQIESTAQKMQADVSTAATIAELNKYTATSVGASLAMLATYHTAGDDAKALACADDMFANLDKDTVQAQVAVLSSVSTMYQIARPTPQIDKAYAAYKRWLEIQPGSLEAMNNMACLLADSYDPPRAAEGLTYAQRALDEVNRQGITEPRFQDTHGWLLILNGSTAGGVSELSTLVDSPNQFPDLYFHLAEGHLRLQYADQAVTEAKMGLSLVDKMPADQQDARLRGRLKDVLARAQEAVKGKQQAQGPQAQAP